MLAIYLLTVFFNISNLIIILIIYFYKHLHFNNLLFKYSDVFVFYLAILYSTYQGLLLIHLYLFIYLFVVVSAAGRKSHRS
jgi:hypothetical protein